MKALDKILQHFSFTVKDHLGFRTRVLKLGVAKDSHGAREYGSDRFLFLTFVGVPL